MIPEAMLQSEAPVARILIPLVLNGDSDKAAILGHGDTVRLTAQIATAATERKKASPHRRRPPSHWPRPGRASARPAT